VAPDIEGPDATERNARIGVRDNARASRFEAVLDEEIIGILLYQRPPGTLELIHTVTDPDHRHEGAASALVRTALAEARAQQLQVIVFCPFVEGWLRRHPDQTGGIVRD